MTNVQIREIAIGTTVEVSGWLSTESKKLLVAWFEPMPTSSSWPVIKLVGDFPTRSPYPARVTGTWQAPGAITVTGIAEIGADDLGRGEAFDHQSTYVPDVYFVDPTVEEQAVLTPLLEAGILTWYRVGLHPASGQRGIWAGSTEPRRATAALHQSAVGGVHTVSIARADWGRRELGAIESQLGTHADEWNILTSGMGIDGSGQLRVHATVVFPVPTFLDFAQAVPAGMLSVSSAVRALP